MRNPLLYLGVAIPVAALLLASCATDGHRPSHDGLWMETATRINNQYQVQRPLRRMLEHIEELCEAGESDLAAEKLRLLSQRISLSWTTTNNLPSQYEDLIIQYPNVPAPTPENGHTDDPFKEAIEE